MPLFVPLGLVAEDGIDGSVVLEPLVPERPLWRVVLSVPLPLVELRVSMLPVLLLLPVLG